MSTFPFRNTFGKKSDKCDLPRGKWYKSPIQLPEDKVELGLGHVGKMTRKFGSDGEHADKENNPFELDEVRQ